ncbi:hypothetical protein DFJ74DRAFT_697444 [Hyaloraphidium curvatum]|nr:hypothetical protein DFJ74DRAFT_697444 [Hyaloraphidium curvatum]
MSDTTASDSQQALPPEAALALAELTAAMSEYAAVFDDLTASAARLREAPFANGSQLHREVAAAMREASDREGDVIHRVAAADTCLIEAHKALLGDKDRFGSDETGPAAALLHRAFVGSYRHIRTVALAALNPDILFCAAVRWPDARHPPRPWVSVFDGRTPPSNWMESMNKALVRVPYASAHYVLAVLLKLALIPAVRRRLAQDLHFVDALLMLTADICDIFILLDEAGAFHSPDTPKEVLHFANATMTLVLYAARERPDRWKRLVSDPAREARGLVVVDLDFDTDRYRPANKFLAAKIGRILYPRSIADYDARQELARDVTEMSTAYMNLAALSHPDGAAALYRPETRLPEVLVQNAEEERRDLEAFDRQAREESCDRNGCAWKASEGSELRKCSRCRVAWYCSKECQVADWPSHKLVCQDVAE